MRRGILVGVLRIIFWNALVFAAALCAVGAAGEVYLRLTWPFLSSVDLPEGVPGVGVRFTPHSEVRSTNNLDWWTVQRANSLGFLDREPPSPERAAAGCHVAIVGDSFVEANQVQVSDKVQVRLERLATERFASWDVTVAAYGYRGTGQVAQLPWWDEWIRSRSPKLVALVFVDNDFGDNQKRSPSSAEQRFAQARRAEDGSLKLVPPLAPAAEPPPARYLHERAWRRIPPSARPYVGAWVRHRFRIWRENLWRAFPSLRRPEPAFVAADRQDFTAFALDQWKTRAESGGGALVVLAAYVMHTNPQTRLMLDNLKGLAAERDIPVVDQMGHILAQGGDPRDAHFANDGHWSPQGHQWAAEALLDWMAANPSVCDR